MTDDKRVTDGQRADWERVMLPMSPYEAQQAEWKRLSSIGWMQMTVEDLKGVIEAFNNLLIRDAQWQEKWKSAIDTGDNNTFKARAERDGLFDLLRRLRAYPLGHKHDCNFPDANVLPCTCGVLSLAHRIDAVLVEQGVP